VIIGGGMTETPNERVVRDGFTSVQTQDLEAMLSITAVDVEVRTRLGSVTGEPYRGHEGINRWFEDIHEQFGSFDPVVTEISEVADGRVFAAARVETRGKVSDLPWREDLCYVVDVVDAKVTRIETFLDREEAERFARE
jgi:ketosteroid isomerase-like protein